MNGSKSSFLYFEKLILFPSFIRLMMLMNHRTTKITWRQIEMKYKIWSGLGEAVFSYPQPCRKFFFRILVYILTFPVLKLVLAIRD